MRERERERERETHTHTHTHTDREIDSEKSGGKDIRERKLNKGRGVRKTEGGTKRGEEREW